MSRSRSSRVTEVKDTSREATFKALLDDLCVQLGYCLAPDDQQRLTSDSPQSADAFTDAVVEAEGFDPVLMATEQRQEVRRMVAAAFGEPVRPSGRTRRRR
jgi:hypothetical protein